VGQSQYNFFIKLNQNQQKFLQNYFLSVFGVKSIKLFHKTYLKSTKLYTKIFIYQKVKVGTESIKRIYKSNNV
jgi:hypothetical protein